MSEHVLPPLPLFGRIPMAPGVRNGERRLVMPLYKLVGEYGVRKRVECPKRRSQGRWGSPPLSNSGGGFGRFWCVWVALTVVFGSVSDTIHLTHTIAE